MCNPSASRRAEPINPEPSPENNDPFQHNAPVCSQKFRRESYQDGALLIRYGGSSHRQYDVSVERVVRSSNGLTTALHQPVPASSTSIEAQKAAIRGPSSHHLFHSAEQDAGHQRLKRWAVRNRRSLCWLCTWLPLSAGHSVKCSTVVSAPPYGSANETVRTIESTSSAYQGSLPYYPRRCPFAGYQQSWLALPSRTKQLNFVRSVHTTSGVLKNSSIGNVHFSVPPLS